VSFLLRQSRILDPLLRLDIACHRLHAIGSGPKAATQDPRIAAANQAPDPCWSIYGSGPALPCRNHVPRGGPRHAEGQGPAAPACWFPHGRGRSTASVVICISLRPRSAMSPLSGDRRTGSTSNAREQNMPVATLAIDATVANGSSVARRETVSPLDFPRRRIFSKIDAVFTSRHLSVTECSKAMRSQSDDTFAKRAHGVPQF
jgi:hypothetical protein